MFSASPFLRHTLQRALRMDLAQATLRSSVERCRKTCDKLEQANTDSRQRSCTVFTCRPLSLPSVEENRFSIDKCKPTCAKTLSAFLANKKSYHLSRWTGRHLSFCPFSSTSGLSWHHRHLIKNKTFRNKRLWIKEFKQETKTCSYKQNNHPYSFQEHTLKVSVEATEITNLT